MVDKIIMFFLTTLAMSVTWAAAFLVVALSLLPLLSIVGLGMGSPFEGSVLLMYIRVGFILVATSMVAAIFMNHKAYFNSAFLVILVSFILAFILATIGDTLFQMNELSRFFVQIGFVPLIVTGFMFDDERYFKNAHSAPE
jgi:predicted neutral ceramidase superfamily lipid hydrolase